MLKDKKLLEGINKKKTSAWRALYRYLYGSLCNYAAEICKDAEAADDIVQECLIVKLKSSVKDPSKIKRLEELQNYFKR